MNPFRLLALGILAQMDEQDDLGGSGGGGGGGRARAGQGGQADPPEGDDDDPEGGDDSDPLADDDPEGGDDSDPDPLADDQSAEIRAQLKAAREEIKRLKAKRKADDDEKQLTDLDLAQRERDEALARVAEHEAREVRERAASELSALAASAMTAAPHPILISGLLNSVPGLYDEDSGALDTSVAKQALRGLRDAHPELFGRKARKKTSDPNSGKGRGSDRAPNPSGGEDDKAARAERIKKKIRAGHGRV